MISTERCLGPSPNSDKSHRSLKLAVPQTQHICFPLPPLTCFFSCIPIFTLKSCRYFLQYISCVFPFPLSTLSLSFSGQHLLPLGWPHQQPNCSSWLQYSQFQYTSWTAARAVFPKHRADLVIHLLNVLPTTIEVKLNDFNMAC